MTNIANINDMLRQIGNRPGVSDPFAAALLSALLSVDKEVQGEKEWDPEENK